jgi:hypothetical protein
VRRPARRDHTPSGVTAHAIATTSAGDTTRNTNVLVNAEANPRVVDVRRVVSDRETGDRETGD